METMEERKYLGMRFKKNKSKEIRQSIGQMTKMGALKSVYIV